MIPNLLPLSTGEFSVDDKLQPAEYINARTNKLTQLYKKDPNLTRDLVSLLYPHNAKRPWEHSELKERLGIKDAIKSARLYVEKHPEVFSKIAVDIVNHLNAAFDAYMQSKAQTDMQNQMMQTMKYPALHASQPEMVAMYQQQMGGPTLFDQQPVVHHRRHRHHSG